MPRSRTTRPKASPRADSGKWLDLGFLILASALAGIYVLTLVHQAVGGQFSSDECFHAHMAERILAHDGLPTVMPELYSGRYYYYQPFLHLLGAAWIALFGPAALHPLPVVFVALTWAAVLFAPPLPIAPRVWAILACLSSVALAQYAVRLYVEGLTTLLVTTAGVLFLWFHRTGQMRFALALGTVCGIATLTKLHGWILPAALAGLGLAYGLLGWRPRAVGALAAAALATAIGLPWLVRVGVLFGSPWYPAFAPDLDRTLYALEVRKFGLPPGTLLAGIPAYLGPAICFLALAALGLAILRRRWTVHVGLALFALGSMVALVFVPLTSSRHLNPFVPLLALASSAAIAELAGRKWLPGVLTPILLIPAGLAVATLPDYRAQADPDLWLRTALSEIGPIVPPGRTILSLWTYDTFYYTKRPSTWPVPWGQRRRPLVLFYERDPDRFLKELDQYGIDYLLVPALIKPVAFDGTNYPESFMDCVDNLLKRGALEAAWESPELVLVRNPGQP